MHVLTKEWILLLRTERYDSTNSSHWFHLQGLRNAVLTATKGTAVLNTHFLEYSPWVGVISMREFGSLTAYETGSSSTYALLSIEARGKLFIGPGEAIYEGQVRILHLSVLIGEWPALVSQIG